MPKKFKLDHKSIKFRMILYFILFAAVLMAIIWTLQVFLLNNSYGSMKTSQTKSVAGDIRASYLHNSMHDFLEFVDDVSDSYDMYIYVISYDGENTFYTPSSNITSDYYMPQIRALNERMVRNNGTAYMTIQGEGNQEILAYGSLMVSEERDPLLVYIFSPLWPVSSTIKILKNQLVYVTLISLILACLLAFYLSTRITRPLRKINSSAERLAEGEYGIVFKGGPYTELNTLADTLTGASIELEKSDMMQKDLIANVSHELKTPLTMIKSYAEMIRDLSGDNPEKREEHLQVIIDESDRLNTLVEDLLVVSKMQSGRMALEKSDFNLNDAVSSILSTFRIKELEDNFNIQFNCSSVFPVNADEEKIKQVISNLVSNAIKFCGEDRTVVVSLEHHGRNVTCSIEDHGSGIAPNELEHIWDRYYRASSNAGRSTEGSGLGLAICKEILTLHKCPFGVDSTLGQGTTFWFELELLRPGTPQ